MGAGTGSGLGSGWARVARQQSPLVETQCGAAAGGFFANHTACTVFLKELNKVKKIPALLLTDLHAAFGGVTKLFREDAVLANTCYPGKSLPAFGLRSSSYTDRGFSCTKYCHYRECEQVISSVSLLMAVKPLM